MSLHTRPSQVHACVCACVLLALENCYENDAYSNEQFARPIANSLSPLTHSLTRSASLALLPARSRAHGIVNFALGLNAFVPHRLSSMCPACSVLALPLSLRVVCISRFSGFADGLYKWLWWPRVVCISGCSGLALGLNKWL